MWKLGKIIELIQSRDKEIRSARINVASGKILGRPLNLLYPLKVDNGAEDIQSTTDMMNENKGTPRRATVIAKTKITELHDSKIHGLDKATSIRTTMESTRGDNNQQPSYYEDISEDDTIFDLIEQLDFSDTSQTFDIDKIILDENNNESQDDNIGQLLK
ncbi:Hypothetical predicted protein [Mytilus galloprovincialis]|uniref:DUF5641 domain-containing protein n=1 Tax=Mytilus galloprovincialis TaxID=29158 RepID=A0A8B6H6C3_MYTGA|nr:Hypothetical predicted protein [Mytilus galloprovincialis]